VTTTNLVVLDEGFVDKNGEPKQFANIHTSRIICHPILKEHMMEGMMKESKGKNPPIFVTIEEWNKMQEFSDSIRRHKGTLGEKFMAHQYQQFWNGIIERAKVEVDVWKANFDSSKEGKGKKVTKLSSRRTKQDVGDSVGKG